jgi:hypothetical protein
LSLLTNKFKSMHSYHGSKLFIEISINCQWMYVNYLGYIIMSRSIHYIALPNII